MVVSKGGPLLAAAEAAIDVDSPPAGTSCVEGLEVFGRALHTTPLVGVVSTVVPGCTRVGLLHESYVHEC